MISRGLRGWNSLVEIVVHFEGLSPSKFLYQSCFSKRIDLVSNVLYAIEIFVDVGESTSQSDKLSCLHLQKYVCGCNWATLTS